MEKCVTLTQVRGRKMSTNRKKEAQMDEKKRAFIQEQIVPERNSRIKKGALTVAAVFLCAVLFGTVASLTFYMTGNYFDEMFEEQGGDAVSLEDEEGAEGEDETAQDESREDIEEHRAEEKLNPIIIEEELTLDKIEEAYVLLRKTAREYNHCVVTVSSVMQGVDWFDNPSEMEEAVYGVVLAEDEKRFYILTANDKIQDVESIQVTFSDNTNAEAKLRGKDKITNLAVLSVAKEQLSKETLDSVLVASLGNSYSLTEGTFVIALGSPNGYMYSMDYGMISGQKRDQTITDGKLELFNTSMVYHSAGEGIIVDIDGKIVGLITHAYAGGTNSEISTMIGISRLKTIIEKLINKQPMPYFGIIANDIPEEYKEDLGVEDGIYITEVEGDSPALEVGLRAGDVIVEANDTMVTSIINFSNILAQCQPGDEMKIKVARSSSNGESVQEITIVLGKR